MWAGYRSAPNECALTYLASKQTARSEWRGGHGMHTLIGLFVATAAAYAIARPSGPTVKTALPQLPHRSPIQPPQRYLNEYLMPRLLVPNYFGYDNTIRANPPRDEHEWLNKEIDRLTKMEDEAALNPIDLEFSRWMSQDPYAERPYEGPIIPRDMPRYMPDSPVEDVYPLLSPKEVILPDTVPEKEEVKLPKTVEPRAKKENFAMTPLDKGFFEPEDKVIPEQDIAESSGPHEGGQANFIEVSPPRPIRQNPNLGRSRNLVADNLGTLRTGLAHDSTEGTDRPRHVPVLESDPAEPIYGVALIAAFGTALTMAVVGFAFGWYTLSKKAKAAADVDYPAYGVTGPTMDTSGDRKLAHSAHMYHYQHQKQQIIAMERNGLEQRNGSVSDPESEEENEEGDYTVYECPGFATTGEMEVKNPLFSDDPTPATPGKCELVKPQPKD
ncbi:unnamed protein product [Arctia plantaginis]|uniref:Neural proliferation differentiation and control protein 1 n=1 Tax=Arctia plantaginis TaxID=874455 RepID=A0A8S0Z0G5_ARCPL|nr:unnamed protein product [Arctia plantaginis]CAB3250153.1 unnamed protein product [Arctia plantaginis]